jgi:uncharacterized membrane protein YvlD (DUF360 family)
VPMEVALLGAFALILGAFALILWELLRGRRRGWPRVVAVVVGAPACALAATVISAGIGWGRSEAKRRFMASGLVRSLPFSISSALCVSMRHR